MKKFRKSKEKEKSNRKDLISPYLEKKISLTKEKSFRRWRKIL